MVVFEIVDRLAAAAATRHSKSTVCRLCAEREPGLGPGAIRAASERDWIAACMVEAWAERADITIADAINIVDPDEVVIDGSGARAGKLLAMHESEES